jgi:hypothetical protein
MPRYRKIDPRIWTDEKMRTLSPLDKLVALYIITAQSNRIGLFHFSLARAAEDLQLDSDTCVARVKHVCDTCRWAWDIGHVSDTSPTRVLGLEMEPKSIFYVPSVVYLPTWWKYNPPENASVMKGNLADLHEVPESVLVGQFAENLLYIPRHSVRAFRAGVGTRVRHVSGKDTSPTRAGHVGDTSGTSVAVAVAVTEAVSSPGVDFVDPRVNGEVVTGPTPSDAEGLAILYRDLGGKVTQKTLVRIRRLAKSYGFARCADALERAGPEIVNADHPLSYWSAVIRKPKPGEQSLEARKRQIQRELPDDH